MKKNISQSDLTGSLNKPNKDYGNADSKNDEKFNKVYGNIEGESDTDSEVKAITDKKQEFAIQSDPNALYEE